MRSRGTGGDTPLYRGSPTSDLYDTAIESSREAVYARLRPCEMYRKLVYELAALRSSGAGGAWTRDVRVLG